MPREISIPDHLAHQLEVLAALDCLTPSEIAQVQLEDWIMQRSREVDRAYRALHGPMPSNDNVLDDICDECDQRHGPDDPECAGQDPGAAASDPVEKPEVPPEPPRAGVGSGRDEWAHYARQALGLVVAPNERRTEIIRAVDVHHGRVDPTEAPTVREVFTPTDEDLVELREGSCKAARCTEDAMPGGAKFCPNHMTQSARLAEKLKRSHNPSAEAVRRLTEGVR